jgi:glycosyltransferase involved in cell wall biosynthesis
VSGPLRHLGINALFLEPKMGGLDTYSRALIPELVELLPGVRISVVANAAGAEYLRGMPWAPAVEFVTAPWLGVRGTRAVVELTALGVLADRRGFDVLHSVALTAPLRTRAANVVTLADVTWLTHPSADGGMTYRLWRAVVPTVARRADRVIAISEAGAEDVASWLRVPRERIDVTPLGFSGPSSSVVTEDSAALREALGLGDGPIVLSVGTRKEHKNLVRLVAAFAAVLESTPSARLVLAGNATTHDADVLAEARRLGVEDAVVLLDFVSAERLEGLYAAATCFVLASLNEGFGLPILEAMHRGVPTATSNVSSLPEVAGDAAISFDPLSVDSIARALRALLGDAGLRERLAVAGRERAAGFTWRRTAELTLESYGRALRRRSLK